MSLVIVSRSPSEDLARRALEEELVNALAKRDDVDVVTVPHLYDLAEKDDALKFLRAATGPMLVLAWLYPRAIHSTLDHLHIKAHSTQIHLKDGDTAQGILAEIFRKLAKLPSSANPKSKIQNPKSFASSTAHRWFPVIDRERCTDCMECIEFCLFGVFGVDDEQHLLVESPDNCRKGCPACSRVCPQGAIIFPMHRQPVVAGAPGASLSAQKLDLSELFGAPDALQTAAKERDAALAALPKPAQSKDRLDTLMDALDRENL